MGNSVCQTTDLFLRCQRHGVDESIARPGNFHSVVPGINNSINSDTCSQLVQRTPADNADCEFAAVLNVEENMAERSTQEGVVRIRHDWRECAIKIEQ